MLKYESLFVSRIAVWSCTTPTDPSQNSVQTLDQKWSYSQLHGNLVNPTTLLWSTWTFYLIEFYTFLKGNFFSFWQALLWMDLELNFFPKTVDFNFAFFSFGIHHSLLNVKQLKVINRVA